MALVNAFGNLALDSTLTTLSNKIPAQVNEMLPVSATNVSVKLRDACEAWPNPSFWEETEIGADDFIIARGNTGGAGWIEISKDPSTPNTETIISVATPVYMPIKLTHMVSLTHRNAGEQIAQVQIISDDASVGLSPLDEPTPTVILNASQSTTTITINFSAAPTVMYRVGQLVSIYGFIDTRLNVNNATVASVLSPTQITIVGNDYAFTSTTIGSTLGNGIAFIERLSPLSNARNGISIVHGNATVTQRRFYIRSQGGDARPSGVLASSHHVTTGTDVSTALVNGFGAESWSTPLETVTFASRDGVTISDRVPDQNLAMTARFRQSQIVPRPDRPYKIRFRVRSTPSLTRPIAKIVSITKSGSTTTTITTSSAHGLTTGQYVGFYGVRDQANFVNQTAGLICTVTGTNTFTVVYGAVLTATSYGGFVVRFQGQQLLGGAINQVAQSINRTNNILIVTGNTNFSAPVSIGNIVQLIGIRDNATGADLLVDGAYVVINMVTNTLTVTPVDGHAPTGANITTTNCGGGIVQRFGMRIHAVTAVDFDPLMTEAAYKGLNDAGEGQPVNGAVTITSGAVTATMTSTTVNPVVPTPYIANSVAGTNIGLIINASSGLQAFYATNIGTTAAYVKLYNKATAPVLATDIPAMVIVVPAAVAGVPGIAVLPMGISGFRFLLGLGIAITGDAADTDATAVAAGQVKVNLSRSV